MWYLKMTDLKRIDIKYLLDWDKHIQVQYKKSQQRNPEQIWRAYSVSQVVLTHFLGIEWVEKYVMNPRSPIDYLRTAPNSDHDWIRHLSRVIELGEMLLNLQDVPGIIERIESLKRINNPKYGKIEDIVAELVCAKILFHQKIPFRFIITSGIKRADYDLEFLLKGQKICCETKCKLEQTEFSENTILESLKVANGQLPDENPGVIMVSIPERWNKETILIEKLEKASKRFYGQNDKIISIIYHSDDFFFDDQITARIILIKEYNNSNSKFGNYDELINGNELNSNWINLIYLVKENTT